jgi:hypothetical protein
MAEISQKVMQPLNFGFNAINNLPPAELSNDPVILSQLVENISGVNKTLIKFTGQTPANTVIDLLSNGDTWTRAGGTPYLGNSAGIFNETLDIQVESNGRPMSKPEQIEWVSSTSIKIKRIYDAGERLFILGGAEGGQGFVVNYRTLIEFTEQTPINTIMDLTADGDTWTKDGDDPYLGPNSGTFNSSLGIEIESNGRPMSKPEQVEWVSPTSIKIKRIYDAGERLFIYS